MTAAVPESKHPHHSDSGSFQVKYLGNIVLGRRYTPIILPWVLAEVKRKGEYRCITLNVQKQFLQGTLDDIGSEVIFNHKLNRLSRFTRVKWDPACFAYLTREDIEKSPFTCHVFIAVSHEEVRNSTKLVQGKWKVSWPISLSRLGFGLSHRFLYYADTMGKGSESESESVETCSA